MTCSCVVAALLLTLAVYKYMGCNRLLAPRVVKHEPKIEDFIVRANDNVDAEGGLDINLNPVVQARFMVEAEQERARKHKTRGAAAYGALRKLRLGLSGRNLGEDQARKGQEGLNVVDAALQREAKRNAHVEAEAIALVQQAHG